MKKILMGLAATGTAIAMVPLFAAFEAHVINVTAKIENALYVHPQSLEYGTVFPQEHLDSSFFMAFSQSFSETNQRRVGTVEYVIKQKPKPREAFVQQVGVEAARDYCHSNSPANAGDPNDPYYVNCYPNLCPYLSKHPDNFPAPGNDVGVPAFHNPEDPNYWAEGKLVKFPNVNNDPADIWTVDLAVPCFEGQCAQDWADFVHGLNPSANPDDYVLDPGLEHQVFGCDLWAEVTSIY
jgi:hypothetical protein